MSLPPLLRPDLEQRPADLADWGRLLWIPLAVYALLCALGAARGLAILSIDDHMRHLIAVMLFDPARELFPEAVREDTLVWPWGHILIVRWWALSIGQIWEEDKALVFLHFLFGCGGIAGAGALTRAIGGRGRAIFTAALAFATMPWALRFGLSILSDQPTTVLLIWGVALHWTGIRPGLREGGALRWHWVFAGDVLLCLATTMRYEAWALMGAAWGLTSLVAAWHSADRLRAAARCALRLPIVAGFPLFWMGLHAYAFDGNALFFQLMAAHRVVEHYDWQTELVHALRLLALTAPVLWLAGLAAGGRMLFLWRHHLVNRSRAEWLPALSLLVIAATYIAFYIWSSHKAGRPSNLGGRFMYMTTCFALPVAALGIGRAVRGGASRWLWLLALGTMVGFATHAMVTDRPHRAGMPLALSGYARDVIARHDYGRESDALLQATWEEYEHTFEGLIALRPLSVRRRNFLRAEADNYTERLLEPNTVLVMAANRILVARIAQARPRAVVFQEGPDWYLIDLTGQDHPDLVEALLDREGVRQVPRDELKG